MQIPLANMVCIHQPFCYFLIYQFSFGDVGAAVGICIMIQCHVPSDQICVGIFAQNMLSALSGSGASYCHLLQLSRSKI